MRPGAIIAVAVLFVVAFVALLIGTKGYEKIDEIHTMESRISSVREKFPEVEHIGTATLVALQHSGSTLLILDVRTPEEFAVSHLPGARNIREAENAEPLVAELKPDFVVLYGSTGLRSAVLAKELQDRGVSGVRNMAGSIFAWANEGLPMENEDGGSVRVVHPGDRSEGHLLKSELHAPSPR